MVGGGNLRVAKTPPLQEDNAAIVMIGIATRHFFYFGAPRRYKRSPS